MKRSSIVPAILITVTLGLASLAAADYSDGLAAHVKGDYATACKEFKALAEKGEAKAQVKLGDMLGKGQCGPANSGEAAKWIRLAAEQGYADAQVSYGVLNSAGNGVPRSDTEAANWFRKAAEQGNPVGQWMLGKMYEGGKGLTKSDEEAVKWYRRAAQQKNGMGQRLLGVMYANGRGVTQDYVQAYMWLTLALENGSADSAEIRFNFSKKMTKEQISEAAKLAKEWKPNKANPEEKVEKQGEPAKTEAPKDEPAKAVKKGQKKSISK